MAIEITNRAPAPYSAVCYLEVTFPNGVRVRGSGVVVGPNDVLTALHVVFSQTNGGLALAVRIVPGGDTLPQTSPLGEFTDVQRFASRVSNWDSNGDGLLFAEESQGDLALLGLSTRIGDVTGWLPLDAQRSSFSAQLLGYPSRGTGLMSATSFAQPDANTSNLIVGLGLGEGASGGPIVHTIDGEAHVAGTLSSGDGGLTTSRYAALFGNANLPWLQAAIAANDDLITARTTLRLQGGSDNDTLAGNPANDVLFGGGGRDCITGSGGSDLIDGGTGVDTVWLRGPRGDYGLSETTGAINPPAGLSAQAAFTLRLTDTAPGRDGTLDLSRVERLQFSDLAMALDVRGEAGDAVSIVGAVLGLDAARSPYFRGIALAWLDRGNSLQSLAQLGLDVVLGPAASTDAVLGLLYQNYAGQPADAITLAALRPLLDAATYTPASLTVAVSQLQQHPVRAELAGLQAIDYAVFAA